MADSGGLGHDWICVLKPPLCWTKSQYKNIVMCCASMICLKPGVAYMRCMKWRRMPCHPCFLNAWELKGLEYKHFTFVRGWGPPVFVFALSTVNERFVKCHAFLFSSFFQWEAEHVLSWPSMISARWKPEYRLKVLGVTKTKNLAFVCANAALFFFDIRL